MKLGMFHLVLSLAAVLPLAVVQVKAAEPVDESQAVELFQAMEEGLVEVKLVPKNSLESSLSVTNKTNRPIVVDMPSAFAGVPVLAQPPMGGFGGGGFGGGPGGGGFGGGAFGGDDMGRGGRGGRGGMDSGRGGNSNSGGNQSIGGGMGGGRMGGMGGGMGGRRGGGMFSIAPNKTHKEAVRTVCLEHGKKEPRSTVKYTIVPIDSYTDNKTTQVLCEMLGDKELDQNAVQVAVWSAENGMTMEELAAKTRQTSRNNPVESYFKPGELQLGAELLAQANGRAKVVEEVEKAQADLENYKPEKTDDTIERLTEQVLSE
ncbi:MAG: hypothetical protein IIW01_04555 [Thermoguttaceae bacterium]|nr:hypothetical protein [Thermoguttaceae bacterium]